VIYYEAATRGLITSRVNNVARRRTRGRGCRRFRKILENSQSGFRSRDLHFT